MRGLEKGGGWRGGQTMNWGAVGGIVDGVGEGGSSRGCGSKVSTALVIVLLLRGGVDF